MLTVKSPEEAYSIIMNAFSAEPPQTETLPALFALGRILAEDVSAAEDVPSFNRSTVDGYAVRAADTFGATESLPSMLALKGEVLMGEKPDFELKPGECAALPTGGELPAGADAAVMIEHTDIFNDLICINKPSAVGANVVSRGEDVTAGETLLRAGDAIRPQDVGTLHSLGIADVSVRLPITVGIISTGDELIPIDETPTGSQIRDVNSGLIAAGVLKLGAQALLYGIKKDDYDTIDKAVDEALAECDVVVISGGSSVGLRDATASIIEKNGELLLHGVAVKPGKPTIAGKAGGKAIFGLPGHPMAAFFIFTLFVAPLINKLMGKRERVAPTVRARLTRNIPSNDGRCELVAVALKKHGDGSISAEPVQGKSGLISTLTRADGYVIIDRDCEGLPAGAEAEVIPF